MNQQTNRNFLQNFWDTGKFASSWIIATDNLDRSLHEIKQFAHSILGVHNLPLENNPDFRIVERGLNTSKNEAKYINVEQIREIQTFMNSTSSVSECKIAVICEADLMNLNAYNCCLKILEEAPRDSYIFLLTERPGNIIATIKSRCAKVSDMGVVRHINETFSSYDSSNRDNSCGVTISELRQYNIAEKIKLLQEITAKDSKELWRNFCDDILDQLHKKRDILRFDRIHKLMQDTQDFDLDKRQMGILIMECV
jgi:DNA polymerase-3 subunit delta'